MFSFIIIYLMMKNNQLSFLGVVSIAYEPQECCLDRNELKLYQNFGQLEYFRWCHQ